MDAEAVLAKVRQDVEQATRGATESRFAGTAPDDTSRALATAQGRAEAAEAKLNRIAQVCREHLPRVAAEDVLGIIGDEVA